MQNISQHNTRTRQHSSIPAAVPEHPDPERLPLLTDVPNILSMIGRRASHSDHLPQARANFDYLPTSGLMPPSLG